MTQMYRPDWSDEGPEWEDARALAEYYDTHDTSAELEDAIKVYEVQQIYRVVDAETNTPLQTGGYHGRQHVYLKEGTARGVVTQKNNHYARIGNSRRYKVQVADAEWRDLT